MHPLFRFNSLVFALLLCLTFSILLFTSCKKTDVNPGDPLAEKFFSASPSLPNPVLRGIEEFKRQNSQTGFLKDFVRTAGYPKWEECVIENRKTNNQSNFYGASSIGNAPDTLVFVPVVRAGEAYVSSFILMRVSDSVQLNLYRENDYELHPSGPLNSEVLSAERVTLQLMELNKLVYGYDVFEVKDTSLFRDILPVSEDIGKRTIEIQTIANGTNKMYYVITCVFSRIPGPSPTCYGYWLEISEEYEWPSDGPIPTTTGGGGGGVPPTSPPNPGDCTGVAGCNPGTKIIDGRLPCGDCGPGPIGPETPTYMSVNPIFNLPDDTDSEWWDDPTTSFPAQPLPQWALVYANFPKKPDGTEMCAGDVYALIGGPVLNLYQSDPVTYANACALRLSRALNYSGVTIPNIPGHTFKGGDGLYYFLRTARLYNWMKKTFPAGSGTVFTKQQGGPNGMNFPTLLSGKRGIYLMQASYPSRFGAVGHASLFDGTSCFNNNCDGTLRDGNYFNATGGVEKITLWELP